MPLSLVRSWRHVAAWLLVSISWWGVSVVAAPAAATTPPAAEPSSSDPRDAFVDRMVRNHRFTPSAVRELLGSGKYQQTIVDAISRPAEKALPWRDYRKIFVVEPRIRQGVQFWRDNEATLARASQQFGVEPEVIVAIIGVETGYGRNMGSYRVIDALTTLAFGYPPRGAFFTDELEHFLVLARDQRWPIARPLGSYAGAMGYGQFISSSYRNFAVDFSGDGRVDLMGNVNDAIGSVANYFQRHGWKAGQPVVLRLTPPALAFAPLVNGSTEPTESLGDLAAKGLSAGALKPDDKVALFRFEGDAGDEYWAGLRNFYVITRYNRSPMYALAVWQLAQAVVAARGR